MSSQNVGSIHGNRDFRDDLYADYVGPGQNSLSVGRDSSFDTDPVDAIAARQILVQNVSVCLQTVVS